jgi:hypothetical protein
MASEMNKDRPHCVEMEDRILKVLGLLSRREKQ